MANGIDKRLDNIHQFVERFINTISDKCSNIENITDQDIDKQQGLRRIKDALIRFYDEKIDKLYSILDEIRDCKRIDEYPEKYNKYIYIKNEINILIKY